MNELKLPKLYLMDTHTITCPHCKKTINVAMVAHGTRRIELLSEKLMEAQKKHDDAEKEIEMIEQEFEADDI